MPPKNIKRKMGSMIEPQKVDQDPVLGTTSNIVSGDHPSPSTMSISEQSLRDNEVSGSADIEKVVAIQPPPRPRSPTEPGQIRENPFEENESSPSSNGITVRSSPMASYAARKQDKSTAVESRSIVVRNNNDEEGNPSREGGMRTQALIRLIESQENEAPEILDHSLKEVRSQQIDYLNKRFQAIREWVEDNPQADEPTEVLVTPDKLNERKEELAIVEDKVHPPNSNEEDVLGEHTSDNGGLPYNKCLPNEGLNINASAKPSTRHVYPNGKMFDKMLNNPRFVNIPGSTRNIGDKLEWAD
ncbi:hypothetical protein GGU11DRAFT_751062 [Lentinula aff. detonsa]|nr:hypothetical protein GGU11DRAFT_751062 [Lentinula aff. detonsa]